MKRSQIARERTLQMMLVLYHGIVMEHSQLRSYAARNGRLETLVRRGWLKECPAYQQGFRAFKLTARGMMILRLMRSA